MYCTLVDYCKSIDSVSRISLWQKLLHNSTLLIVLQSLYKNAKSCVWDGSNCSDFFASNIGVSQGENLLRLLFSIFLNDLTEFMSHAYSGLNDVCNMSYLLFDNDDIEVYFKLYLLLCADYTVFFTEYAADFQSALNAMYLYCETWNL